MSQAPELQNIELSAKLRKYSRHTFGIDPVCVDIHIRTLVQRILHATITDMLDLDDAATPASRAQWYSPCTKGQRLWKFD